MLKKVIMRNFGPIKKEAVLSMEKGKTEQYLDNVIEGTGLLKNIYIYGTNNSGKSKVIESLKLLKEIINEGKEVFSKGYAPYLFSKFINEIMDLEYFFIIDNIEYKYTIRLNFFNKEIESEELALEEKVIFLREGNIAKQNGNEYKLENDIFYLTYYYSQIGNLEEINKLVDYIKHIVFLDQQRESHLGIRRSSNSIKKISYLEQNINELNTLIDKFGFDFELTIIENPLLSEKYIGAKRGDRQFSLAVLESFGTNVFIDLLLEIEQAKTSSQLIVIDEIERGIHFALVAGFINYINTKYPKKQLILPTHMTDLLESDLKIRKDQIYISTIIKEDGLKLERKFNKRVIRETMNFQKILKSKTVGGIPEISAIEVN